MDSHGATTASDSQSCCARHRSQVQFKFIHLFIVYTLEWGYQRSHHLLFIYRVILEKTLNDGIDTLDESRRKLEKSLLRFDSLGTNLIALSTRFDDKFEEKMKCFKSKLKILLASSTALASTCRVVKVNTQVIPKINEKIEAYHQFYNDLKEKIQQEFHHMDTTKAKLHDEIQSLGDLKLKTESVKWYINSNPPTFDDEDKSVTALIVDSRKYRKKHQPTNN